MRALLLLVASLFVSSCVVPPSCFRSTFGFSGQQIQHFATISVYSEPVEEPLKRAYPAGVGMWERFERGATIHIDASGNMMVLSRSIWPESCPRVSRTDLAEVSRIWQPLLERLHKDRTRFMVMENPYTGDDWRATGPLLSLSFGSTSEKTVGLLWDGQSSLPESLDTAVIATLELACSSHRRARKYLLRDLPPQVANRLECSTNEAG